MNRPKYKHWLSMAFNRIFITALILFFGHVANAQVNRYLIFFKDKSGSTYDISSPLLFLSPKAVDRRVRQGIAISTQDFPVNKNYVQELSNIGVQVFFSTRWLNGVLVQCDASLLPDINALNFVKSVELIAPGEKLLINGRKKSIDETNEEGQATATTLQLSMLGIDTMHSQGYHGENVTIAVMDSGFPNVNTSSFFQHLVDNATIDMSTSYDFVYNTSDVFRYDQHGAKVLSILAANKADVFTGSAYGANFLLFVTEDIDTEYRIEEYNWLFAAERADSAGADVISTSLGYNSFDDPFMNYEKSDIDGVTAVITQAAQLAAERGILVICSAGNEGANSWGIVTPPADAKDVLAIGNINSFGSRSITSSMGPTEDGRIKPDLVALGTNVSVVTPNGSLSSVSGTSYAAPLVAGMVAGLWQHYPNLTNKNIIEVLKRTASQSMNPDNFLGWGLPNFVAAENFLDFVEQKHPFEIFPNPFHEIVSIRSQNPDEISSCYIEVLNVHGQSVKNEVAYFNWMNPAYQSNFSNLTSGLYILRISFQKSTLVYKIVKY